ncbi:ATP-binding protein [Streptomyces roseicoloratus]|uniref:ATP-binding protein n=1 Tax=Streptomyces roseicoloratus TaxID=2508722 RepID=A0ABY9RQ76_9ACTN|nr:ATP-binding protein [Streptomyces roseicoloratus]WMX44349.1 ATP-binding protein [Streptomyces roseicoloratus]
MRRGDTRNGGAEDPAGTEGTGNAGVPADEWRDVPPDELPPLARQQQVRRLLLNSAAGAVTRCRDFTYEALTDWGWLPAAVPEDQERAEDVLLLVSEVVTNACLHADGPEELVLRHSAGRLRVEVYDGNPAHPRARVPRSPAMPGGHGLMVLDRLAGAWGSEAKPNGAPGKVVWLEVRRPSPPPWLRLPRD